MKIVKYDAEYNKVIALVTNNEIQIRVFGTAKVNPKFEKLISEHENVLKDIAKQEQVILNQNEITNWQVWVLNNYKVGSWSKSPYSNSFYNAKNITWGYKPEGSLRISDHWNFESLGEKHCVTEDPSFTQGWAICKYSKGVYKVIKKFKEEKVKF